MTTPHPDNDCSSDKVHAIHDDNHIELTSVRTSEDNRYVHLGNKTYLREDLQAAFGGTFNPGLHTVPRLRLGNSSPMALFAFATTTLIVSLINASARGLHTSNIMLGCGLFYGGAVQIIAGIWELVCENTFGATVFAAYGGFWMSYAVIFMNGFNIASAYKTHDEYMNALAIFHVVWAIVTLLFLMCTLRSTVAMFLLLLSVLVRFILLAATQFTSTYSNLAGQSTNLEIAAGVFGVIAAFLAYYNGMAGLLTRENSWVQLNPIYMPGAVRPENLDAA